MKRSRFTEEQIIGLLREQEGGAKTADVCRKHGISAATFYKFKAKFGGMDASDARRLNALEDENARLGGSDLLTPGSDHLLRGNGTDAWFGWPTAPKIEALRNEWLDAPDAATAGRLAREIQAQAFADLRYIPLEQFFYDGASRAELKTPRRGMVLPINVARG